MAPNLKQVWRDGTTHVVLSPHELIEKLIPLVPRPRAHVIRYHGILGPAKDRAKVVARPWHPAAPSPARPRHLGEAAAEARRSLAHQAIHRAC